MILRPRGHLQECDFSLGHSTIRGSTELKPRGRNVFVDEQGGQPSSDNEQLKLLPGSRSHPHQLQSQLVVGHTTLRAEICLEGHNTDIFIDKHAALIDLSGAEFEAIGALMLHQPEPLGEQGLPDA